MAEYICPHCHAVTREKAAVCPDDGSILIEVPVLSDLSGRVLRQKYRLDKSLGQGGFGAVYQATHLVLGKTVAVKVLRAEFRSDSNMVARFFHEARVVTRLTNPHTITTFDLDQAEDGFLFMVMDFVEGRTLRKLAHEEGTPPGRLPWRRALRLLMQVCDSLEEAHRAGVIHRDLKPDNIMVSNRGGEADFVTVLDFGIAKVIEGSDQQNLTAAGMLLGSPAYMSPEQVKGGKLGPRSDIYSLGALTYQVLCGALPINARQTAAMLAEKILNRPDPPSRKVPGLKLPMDLEYLVMRMLEVDEEARPASAAQIKGEMVRFLAAWPEGNDDAEDLTLAALDASQPDGTRGYEARASDSVGENGRDRAPFATMGKPERPGADTIEAEEGRHRAPAASAGGQEVRGTLPLEAAPLAAPVSSDVAELRTRESSGVERDPRGRAVRLALIAATVLVVLAATLAAWAWWSGRLGSRADGPKPPDMTTQERGGGEAQPAGITPADDIGPAGITPPADAAEPAGSNDVARSQAEPADTFPDAAGTPDSASLPDVREPTVQDADASVSPADSGVQPKEEQRAKEAGSADSSRPKEERETGTSLPKENPKAKEAASADSSRPKEVKETNADLPKEDPKAKEATSPDSSRPKEDKEEGLLDEEERRTIREMEKEMEGMSPSGEMQMDDDFDDDMGDDQW